MPNLQLICGRLALSFAAARRRTSRQEGQALIEYALIISLIAIVAIGALSLTGNSLKGLLTKIAGDV